MKKYKVRGGRKAEKTEKTKGRLMGNFFLVVGVIAVIVIGVGSLLLVVGEVVNKPKKPESKS